MVFLQDMQVLLVVYLGDSDFLNDCLVDDVSFVFVDVLFMIFRHRLRRSSVDKLMVTS